jgi:hypothetical protein
MTAPTLLQPKPQFCDPNGKPYTGGLIGTFVKGTMTPKTTWKDPDQIAINTNPITLDGAGECSMWGDGDYRLILYDAVGNLIWDQPATTIVSAAMYPVTSAPTTLDAMNILGIPAAIAVETARAEAQEAALFANDARYLLLDGGTMVDDGTNDGSLFLAHDPVSGMEAANKRYVDDGVVRLEAADVNLQTQISLITGAPTVYMQSGRTTLGAGGSVHIPFPVPFAHSISAVVCTLADATVLSTGAFGSVTFAALNLTTTGCDVVAYQGSTAITTPPAPLAPTFYWVAIGS